jgi:hypothetical protein
MPKMVTRPRLAIRMALVSVSKVEAGVGRNWQGLGNGKLAALRLAVRIQVHTVHQAETGEQGSHVVQTPERG